MVETSAPLNDKEEEMAEEKSQGRNVYLTLHEDFVREDVAYTDRATGKPGPSTRCAFPPAPLSTDATWAATSSVRSSWTRRASRGPVV